MLTVPTVDLSNCDREPIHIPGSIQPHGCLLACDPGITVVNRYSANANVMLRAEGALKGRHIADLLGDEATHDLRNAIAQAPDPSRPAVIAHLRLPNGDISTSRYIGSTTAPSWNSNRPCAVRNRSNWPVR